MTDGTGHGMHPWAAVTAGNIGEGASIWPPVGSAGTVTIPTAGRGAGEVCHINMARRAERLRARGHRVGAAGGGRIMAAAAICIRCFCIGQKSSRAAWHMNRPAIGKDVRGTGDINHAVNMLRRISKTGSCRIDVGVATGAGTACGVSCGPIANCRRRETVTGTATGSGQVIGLIPYRRFI